MNIYLKFNKILVVTLYVFRTILNKLELTHYLLILGIKRLEPEIKNLLNGVPEEVAEDRYKD